MKPNTIAAEDCCVTMLTLQDVNYIFTVPPDFEELKLDPTNEDDCSTYQVFVTENVLAHCRRLAPLITVGITDRRAGGGIIPKHSWIIRSFERADWRVVAYKIWHKSNKINLYRLNFLHLMTFCPRANKPKQTQIENWRYDVFTDEHTKYNGYGYGIPLGIVQRHVRNFTSPGQTVYDPFMGSGTTALACACENRFYFGSEIDPKVAAMANERLREYKWSARSLS
jgi:hypothetical protein